jgi:GDPmannose 4,6-dehydratase
MPPFSTHCRTEPDECYHLAAQSYVSYSFEDEFSTINTNLNGTITSFRRSRPGPSLSFYFAASSEMFGNARESPQNENTPFPHAPPTDLQDGWIRIDKELTGGLWSFCPFRHPLQP